MVRKIENFVLLISFVAALLVVNPSSSNPIQNDILEELKAELKNLRLKVDLLEARNVDNEATILKQGDKIVKLESAAFFSSDEHAALHSTDHKMKTNPTNREEISSLDGQDSARRSASTRAIVPSSCRDLALIGHSLDGLYLVQNVDTNKIQTVLCDFGTSLSQQLVGDVDVKTKSVHFYVQRNTTFSTGSAVIPWEVAPLNEGGAMDLGSGIFTVPVNGIYHFEFSGLKPGPALYLWVTLRVNGEDIAAAGTSDGVNTGTYESHSLTASLRLKTGDRVNLYNFFESVLYETTTHKTHFTGWLVEQDLSPTVVI